jgi:hypothetical protein
MGRSIFVISAGIVALFGVSAAVATPIWWLATNHTTLYTVIVGTITAAALGRAIIRSAKRRERTGTQALSSITFLLALAGAAWGITIGSLLLVVISGAVISVVAAVRTGR